MTLDDRDDSHCRILLHSKTLSVFFFIVASVVIVMNVDLPLLSING